ncbi:MAG: GHKL domain-containing protein [Clostridia bacterium]|nr:GHKL domain-containing protein [Clostridia bacterium]
MNSNLYLRYMIELLMIVPAAVTAILPVYYSLRVFRHYLFGWLVFLGTATVFGGAAVCALWNLPSNAIIFPAILVLFPFYHFCFDLSLSKKLFCFAHAVMLCGFSTTYCTFLTAPLELANAANVYTAGSGLICLGVAAVMTALFAHLLITKFPYLLENETFDSAWRYLAIAPVVTAVTVIWMNPISASNAMTGRLRMICLVVLLAIPAVALFLCHSFWWLAKEMTKSAELQRNYDLLRMEEKQYQLTYRHLMDLKELRHDFRQHLLIISDYARTGQTDKLTEYIAPLMESVDRKPLQICENQALNAIISHYDTLAKEQNVKVLWGIELGEKLPVSEADVCRVIGNLLENAIHAVSRLPENDRVVDLRAGMIEEGTLAIHITNPYEGSIPLDKEGFPIIEKKNHGIGLRSVQSAAEKYNGEVIILTKHQTFEVDVLMYADAQT